MRRTTVCLLSACLAASAGWSSVTFGNDHDNEWRGESAGDGGLAGIVRDATRRFRDLGAATAEGYGLFLGCVSSPDEGAMGVHYANGTLVGDDVLDATRPEVLVYEPGHHGSLRLVAVEFLVLADAWNASHETPPVLEGQSFHFTNAPNRYGLPAFYALHVWAWKHNPHGTFVNWNPNVSCAEYEPPAT